MKIRFKKWHGMPTVALLVALVLLGVAIIRSAPALIRGVIIPAYVTVVYGPVFNHTFQSNFEPINALLKQTDAYPGIEPSTVFADCASSDDVQYSGIQESVSCQRTQTTYGVKPLPNFITRWRSRAPGIESYLLSHGWKKEDQPQAITKLFDDPGRSRWINYSKQNGKTACHLWILYDSGDFSSDSASTHKLYTEESCLRSVDFFGGY